MQVKRYEVFDMQEAMERIKKDLGPDAVILSTKKITKPGSFGIFSRPLIEVTAAIDASTATNKPEPFTSREKKSSSAASAPPSTYSPKGKMVASSTEGHEDLDVQRLLDAFKEAAQNTTPTAGASARGAAVSSRPSAITTAQEASAGELSRMMQEIKEIKELLRDESLASRELRQQQEQITQLRKTLRQIASEKYSVSPSYSEQLYAELYDKFTAIGLDRYISRKMVDALRAKLGANSDQETVWRHVRQLVKKLVPMAGPIEVDGVNQKVVALVGPTGVGKTTTIAKLAADYLLNKGVTVGLVTLDTYRIAAIEQLKTYANIINAPVEVVNQNDSLMLALRKNFDRDLVLVDTAGRSHNDTRQIEDLVRFLREDRVKVEVHLVLSATTNLANLTDIIDRFQAIEINRVIVTKLDETASCGSIFSALAKKGLPVSYFTNGQDVPNDLMPAEATTFYDILFGAGGES
ncbi:flagellar biosynthesis protein FlhF [Chrysiogenes arsenatis]|uniref:flagellar biosynthesis protein FlhF n=1 Tax=Chrysiogenes arsenatis TaxID=309797 RepID=UPI0004102F27|nr:flagellar biosynthesis protein FlhF [Chrysiogenes arsenatis]